MADFASYLSEAIGAENARKALEALTEPASVSVRLNPSKTGEDFAPKHFAGAEPVAWSPYGHMLPERPQFTLDPHFHAGAYYVQDSSAMFVGHAFRSVLDGRRGLRVLDLCAAPGGKTTDLAASLRAVAGDDFLLVANEVMKQRAGILADNVGIWGDPCVIVTSADPKAFARLEGFFDIIVADVPCSGEGMFRKDEEAQRQWSEDTVALCEMRQRRILADVWPSLADGGMFVYSTCTFNRRENDGNVAWAAENLGAEVVPANDAPAGVLPTEHGWSLVPGFVKGEGQYCAVLRKHGETPVRRKTQGHRRKPALPAGLAELFDRPVELKQRGDMIIAVPETIAQTAAELDILHPILSGTAVGVMKGRDLVPAADLALSAMLRKDAFARAEVDLGTALKYLHKDPVLLPDAPKGLVLICHEGLPLGFVKNLGNRCNSLLPQDRRIRMNIN